MALDFCFRNLASASYRSRLVDASDTDEPDVSGLEEFDDYDFNDLVRLLAEAKI